MVKTTDKTVKTPAPEATPNPSAPVLDHQDDLDLDDDLVGGLQVRSFAFLHFTKDHEWYAKEAIITGDEGIARIDDARAGYVRFQGKKVVERSGWVQVLGNPRPERPDSFSDERDWGTWEDGRKKDPWVFKIEVPITITSGRLAGRTLIFSNENEACRAAIGDLLAAAKAAKREGKPAWRPLVKLVTFGDESLPTLQIIEFTDDKSVVLGLGKSAVANKPQPRGNGADRANAGADRIIDDEIPF